MLLHRLVILTLNGNEQPVSCTGRFTHEIKHYFTLNRRLGENRKKCGPFREDIYILPLLHFEYLIVHPITPRLY